MCVSVLTSCPEACDPDVRLWALRTRQEHIVSRGRSCTILPSTFKHTLFLFVCFPFFSLCTICDIWAVSSVRSLWSKKVFLACVCVCDRGRLRVRFVCISSLFVHIWPETQKHPVFSVLWDVCAGDHNENNCGNCDFFSLRVSEEGAGFERVLKQPWNKKKEAFLHVEPLQNTIRVHVSLLNLFIFLL